MLEITSKAPLNWNELPCGVNRERLGLESTVFGSATWSSGPGLLSEAEAKMQLFWSNFLTKLELVHSAEVK